MEPLKVTKFHKVVSNLERAALAVSSEQGPTVTVESIIDGVHGALESAMVCALDENSLASGKLRRTVVFEKMLERCQELERIRFGPPLTLEDSEFNDIMRLHNDYRAHSIHTKPRDEEIPWGDLPHLVAVALTVIDQLMCKELWSLTDDDQEPRFDKAVETIKNWRP
jgi:hypothetical protein